MKKKLEYLLILCFITGKVLSQMPNDGVYMRKHMLCFAGMGSQSQWNKYWENELKRENFNIGTNTTRSAMLMAAYGFTNKLNLIVGLPYISTKNSAGNLLGQKGIQDFGATIKYKFYTDGKFSMNVSVSASTPVSSYVADFLPMSIGLGTKTIAGRLIANYRFPMGIYFLAHGGYTMRSDIKIDRDSYQSYNEVYNTNRVNMPNVFDGGVNIGFLRYGIQAMVFIEKNDCIKGDYIRRNDMPFPTNDMESLSTGTFIKYQPKHLGVGFRFNHVLDGRNVGQSNTISAAVFYQFKAIKDKPAQATHQ